MATFAPFLFVFAAYIAVQHRPRPRDAVRMPGGVLVAYIAGGLGLASSALALVLATVPSSAEPHKAVAVAKVVGLSVVMVGVGVTLSRRRASSDRH